jgi:multiple sugar transport system permease protein
VKGGGSAQDVARPGRRETLAGLAWASPWLVGGTVFVFLPMAMSLYFAFTDYPLIEPPLWAGLANFERMGTDPTFWRVVKNTALYALVAIPMSTALGLVLAGLLQENTRASRFFLACIFMPTLVPLIAAAMVWMWLFNGEYGLVNQLLRVVGINGPTWLVDAAWVLPSMVIMGMWGVGQSVVVYVAAMREVPVQLYEAARIDGMSRVRQFWHVTLPMIAPAILFNVVVMAINVVQVFAVPYVLFRKPDGQNPAGHYYTMYLYENGFVYGQMGYACAMAWVQLLVVVVLTVAMLVASRRLVHARAA